MSQRLAVVGDGIGDDVPDDGLVLGHQKARFPEVLLEHLEGPRLGERRLLDAMDREQVCALGLAHLQAIPRWRDGRHTPG
jgi:hypothetical protein